jgi:hypothetical protein
MDIRLYTSASNSYLGGSVIFFAPFLQPEGFVAVTTRQGAVLRDTTRRGRRPRPQGQRVGGRAWSISRDATKQPRTLIKAVLCISRIRHQLKIFHSNIRTLKASTRVPEFPTAAGKED